MRYDNLPDYPVQPGRSRDQRLKPQPSFGKLMGGLLAAFVALGLVVQLFTGGSGNGTRVAVKEGLPGGVVPALELIAPSSSAVTAAEPVTATTVAASEAPGTLPPTVAPTAPPVALQPAVAAVVAPASTTARSSPPTSATPKVTTPAAPAATAKPKATAPAAPPTTAKPKVTTVAPKPATTAPKPATTPATTARPKPTTTPAPAPPPAPLGTPAQVKAMIQQMWPADSVDKALAVAWRESNYRPDVFNGSCCYGVFQINAGSHQSRLRAHGWTTQDLYDPQVNITIALEIFNEQGWGPWGG